MTSAINEVMLAVVVKATLIAALGLLAVRLARRSRAALRHSLLVATFGVLLVLPIASLVAPPVRIAAPARATSIAAAIAPASADVALTPSVPTTARPKVSALLPGIWIAGTALSLLLTFMGLWRVRSLRRSALPWPDAPASDERAEVLLHETLSGPMTCGILNPAIVLPMDAQSWDAEDLQRALVHELEHVRRRDWLIHCLSRAVCAFYWFHPLVWIAWRKLALEAERSCDDAVLERSDATLYADQLVGLAQRLSVAAKSPVLAMANRADLSTRVRAVLDCRQQRGRAGAFAVALACAVAAVLVLTLSPLKMVAAPQEVRESGTPMPHFLSSLMLVTVDVKVVDKSGAVVEGLKAGDFTVTEDGVPQTISVFEFQKLDAAPQNSISSYYVLGYYTTNRVLEGKFRRIKVTGIQANMDTLDYRSGYYTKVPDTVSAAGPGSGAPNSPIAAGTTPPAVLFRKDPEYSEEARKAKYSGTVVLSVEVGTSGRARDIHVIKSLGMGLDEKAMEAVREWKFRPGMKDGKPVTVFSQVEVQFRLL